MTDYERFDKCRERLWALLEKYMPGHYKLYEGAIDLTFSYPEFLEFDPKDGIPNYIMARIILHCYVFGSSRHYDFKGKTLDDAVDQFEEWLEGIEEWSIENEHKGN